MESYRQRFDRRYQTSRKRIARILCGQEPGWGNLQGHQGNLATAGGKEMKRHFIFVNGILNDPENVESWTDLAEEWVEKNCPKDSATRFEYHAKALTRRLGQEKRVDSLEKIIERHITEKIILVGHSNGCDVIQRLVQRRKWRIQELHLIAAASEADFDKNGFNKAIHNSYVAKIVCYTSAQDEALKQARWSTRIFGWLGLGYGYLGLVGPKNVDDIITDKVDVVGRRLSHSGWFDKENFDTTMKRVTGVNV